MEKKNIAITILIVALVASGVGNIVLAILSGGVETPPNTSDYLVIATSAGPDTLELVDAWDSASNDVLEQVVENLFYYDLTDVNLPRVNILAESYFWADNTHLQIALKEGIVFHDGTDFDAAAAKWNFDRLLFLTNCTGTNTQTVAQTQSLWMFPDGVTPIIASVATVGDYNITITLNGDYAPFLSTLTYINAGMISPTAHASDATTFIDLTTGHLVGTGPFKYETYVPGVEVRFTRNNAYWRDPANFPGVIFSIYSDVTTAHNAFLGYTVDWNRMSADQNLALYEADPKLNVYYFTEDTGKPSLVYQYMGFNNHKYNVTWRRAMAYAINYSYVIDVLRLGNAEQAYSAISPGYGASFNSSIVPYSYDVAAARTLIQSMGFATGLGVDPADDQDWIDLADGTTPLLSVPHTYNTGNSFREDFQVAVTSWFKLIGISVVDDGCTFSQFLTYLYDDYDHLGIYAIGWGPDYLDPYNMIDPLFNPASSSNSAQVDDDHLNTLMASALSETNEAARNIIYQNIQGYLSRMQFHAPLYNSKSLFTFAANLHDIPFNAMGALRIRPVFRGLADKIVN